MKTKQRKYGVVRSLSRAAVVIAISIAAAGCEQLKKTYDDIEHFQASMSAGDTEVTQAKERLAPIIGACVGGQEVLTSLNQLAREFGKLAGEEPARVTPEDRHEGEQIFKAVSDLVDHAYDIAIACGTADPHLTSLASWRSTYWDYSS